MNKMSSQSVESDPPWPIYILTLPGDEDRRAPLLNDMAHLGLTYKLFFGVDGREGLPPKWSGDIDRNAAFSNLGREMTDGEFACALSHREIYREIAEQGLPGAVVLEDDAVLGPHFAEFCRLGLYRNAEMLMLDHSHARVRRESKLIMPGILARKLTLPSCLTTAYSISANAAAELMKAGTPINTTADWPGDIVKLGACALDPPIVEHPDPNEGVSHLRTEREKTPQRQGSFSKAIRRWASLRHWRVWMIKRRSVRIS